MGNINHRRPPPVDLVDAGETFLLERPVAHRQHLVEEKHLRLDRDGDGEGEARPHPRGIILERHTDRVAQLGEGEDSRDRLADLPPFDTEDGGADTDVFQPRKLRVESQLFFQSV